MKDHPNDVPNSIWYERFVILGSDGIVYVNHSTTIIMMMIIKDTDPSKG